MVERQSSFEDLSHAEQKVISTRLREAREYAGLTQAQVAKSLAIQRTSVSELESAKRKVTAIELRRLSRLYRRPVSWLMGEEEGPDQADALYRTARELTDDDRDQVLRFAQFLAAAGKPGKRRSGEPG